MARTIILVIDGFGIGAAADAGEFGDSGSNTFAHIAQHYLEQHGHPIPLPTLASMGLDAAARQVSSEAFSTSEPTSRSGAFAAAAEVSNGKDTPSGHWEMTGVPVLFDWTYFPASRDCFPQEFLDELIRKTGVPGVLGCCHASGTDILRELGEAHLETGKPICYTSADSVFQVAAHEEAFGLDRLYDFCETARELLMQDNVGRVIARPFVGNSAASFTRTGNRRDYSIEPPALTLLDHLVANGHKVCGIGKISDIFAHRGISQSTKATGLEALLDETIRHIKTEADDSLIFTNLVNFDQDFGHRRDPEGYADALIYFDQRLADVQRAMNRNDLLFITSDHGCDPTWEGTEHTREYVPLLAWRHNMPSLDLGVRTSFADLGQTIADLFNIPRLDYGESFLAELNPAD